ncbi:MAG: hypothetical protein ABI691_00565 [Ginsengibacter sp.]
MQLKTIFSSAILAASAMLSSAQDRTTGTIPDSIFNKFKAHDIITHEELALSRIVDFAYLAQSENDANCDTSVSLNDSISWLMISLDNSSTKCINHFLVTLNSNIKSSISNTHLYSDCGVAISADYYKIYRYEIASNNHVLLRAKTMHRLVHRQNFDEQSGNITKTLSNKNISFWIKPNGEISKSRKAPG